MSRHVFVGNLSFDTTPETLRSEFEKNGRTVAEIALVKSPKNGRSRGFGFVEMGSHEQAEAVIRELQGAVIDGRTIKVGEGKARPEIKLRSGGDLFKHGGRGGRGGRR